MKDYIPVHNLNYPNGGAPSAPPITNSTPVYSSYTGNLIGSGNIPYSTTCDAPAGHPNYGKDYHAVIYNPANNSYMAHFNQHSSQNQFNIGWGGAHNHY